MSTKEKVRIGGWLIVIGVLLWLGVIAASLNIVFGLTGITTQPQAIPGLLVDGIINLVLLVPMLVMFHGRRAAIVWWSLVYGIYAVVDECLIQYRHTVEHSSTTFVGHLIAVIVEALLMSGLVMYFFLSKRVKRTFVQ